MKADDTSFVPTSAFWIVIAAGLVTGVLIGGGNIAGYLALAVVIAGVAYGLLLKLGVRIIDKVKERTRKI